MAPPHAQQPGLSPSLHSSQDITCSSLLCCLPAGGMLVDGHHTYTSLLGPIRGQTFGLITSLRARLPEHMIQLKLNCSSTGNQLAHWIC